MEAYKKKKINLKKRKLFQKKSLYLLGARNARTGHEEGAEDGLSARPRTPDGRPVAAGERRAVAQQEARPPRTGGEHRALERSRTVTVEQSQHAGRWGVEQSQNGGGGTENGGGGTENGGGGTEPEWGRWNGARTGALEQRKGAVEQSQNTGGGTEPERATGTARMMDPAQGGTEPEQHWSRAVHGWNRARTLWNRIRREWERAMLPCNNL